MIYGTLCLSILACLLATANMILLWKASPADAHTENNDKTPYVYTVNSTVLQQYNTVVYQYNTTVLLSQNQTNTWIFNSTVLIILHQNTTVIVQQNNTQIIYTTQNYNTTTLIVVYQNTTVMVQQNYSSTIYIPQYYNTTLVLMVYQNTTQMYYETLIYNTTVVQQYNTTIFHVVYQNQTYYATIQLNTTINNAFVHPSWRPMLENGVFLENVADPNRGYEDGNAVYCPCQAILSNSTTSRSCWYTSAFDGSVRRLVEKPYLSMVWQSAGASPENLAFVNQTLLLILDVTGHVFKYSMETGVSTEVTFGNVTVTDPRGIAQQSNSSNVYLYDNNLRLLYWMQNLTKDPQSNTLLTVVSGCTFPDFFYSMIFNPFNESELVAVAWSTGTVLRFYISGTTCMLLQQTAPGFSADRWGVAFNPVNSSQMFVSTRRAIYTLEYPSVRIVNVCGNVSNPDPASIDGSCSSATFWGAFGVTTDCMGFIYVSEQHTGAIRRIDPLTQTVSTIFAPNPNAALGSNGYSGQGRLSNILGIAFIPQTHNLYIAESGNSAIRKLAVNGL